MHLDSLNITSFYSICRNQCTHKHNVLRSSHLCEESLHSSFELLNYFSCSPKVQVINSFSHQNSN